MFIFYYLSQEFMCLLYMVPPIYSVNYYGYVGINDFSKDFPDLLNNPTVLKIAEQHAKTSAQILLRHIVQRGIAVIPKSTNPERIQQNLQVRCIISDY
jgi:diketogulonate reductase-like aldo/keto reductase